MTIASTARKAGPLLGNGSATTFSFGFKVFATGDVKVAIANSAGVETVLTEGADYTVTLNANQETSPGGTVTYPVSGPPLPTGSVLSIIGDLDYDQPLDLPSGGNFSPLALENQLDRATMQIQQLKEQVDRSAKLPQTSTETPDTLVFNITRLAESADNIDTVATSITAVNTVAADVADVSTVASNIGNVAATGANIAAVVVVANDLNEPVSEIETVAGSIANVNAVGSNIANVNTVAGVASDVPVVAGIAGDVAIVADNVADVTNFADVYYGPSASDPALRKDGSALQVGDLYFYTGSKRFKIYDGAGWVSDQGTPGASVVDTFSGDGTTTAFTLSVAPGSENNTLVTIGGVYQQKSEYAVSGTTLTFSTAPVAGANNIEVVSSTTLAIGATTADLVGYIQSGTGAVSTTVQSKLREQVSVFDFMTAVQIAAVQAGTSTDDSPAIQAAINTGKNVVFPAGSYKANNLTQSTAFQRFYARGHVNIVKNANGVLLNSTGSYVEFDGIQFLGTGYTGDNVVATGNHPRFINCASFGAAGRALKATGSHVQIIGTCGVYATTDSSATGYDIEIGVSGTATLYHELWGVYTSQATGGILLVDTGSHHIIGGQFGKLTIKAGTIPAGVNGGMTVGARILGNVNVELSNSVFTGNQFSSVTITFASGTSGHVMDASNNLRGATIVNNGNGNSTIIKSIGTGSPDGIVLQYGQDNNNTKVRYAQDEMYLDGCNLIASNNKSIRFLSSALTQINAIAYSSGDDWTIGGDTGSASGNFMNIIAGSGGMYLVIDGASRFQATSSTFRPVADGTLHLGGASNRFNTIYATNATINTSDEREKQDISALDEAEKRVAASLKGMVKKFRFRDAAQEKGDAARIHVGVIAQEVVAAFQSEGLDPMRYGIVCYDEWGAQDAVAHADGGEIVAPAREAGNRYGIRYEELLAFIIAAL